MLHKHTYWVYEEYRIIGFNILETKSSLTGKILKHGSGNESVSIYTLSKKYSITYENIQITFGIFVYLIWKILPIEILIWQGIKWSESFLSPKMNGGTWQI